MRSPEVSAAYDGANGKRILIPWSCCEEFELVSIGGEPALDINISNEDAKQLYEELKRLYE